MTDPEKGFDTCPRCKKPAKPIDYAPDVPPGGAAYYCTNGRCSAREFVRKADGSLHSVQDSDY